MNSAKKRNRFINDENNMYFMKLAIIGCGAVAEQGHLPGTARCDKVKVTGLIDKNVARILPKKGKKHE